MMTQDEMNVLVPQKLREIEAEHGVKVLHSAETGSRAWGFASPDSDYDVRFVYMRKPDFYLRLEKTRDVIECPIDDTWDVSGWDLKKALQLAHASNPSLIEWMMSPIVYATTPEWQDTVAPAVLAHFQPGKNVFHYLSMAQTNAGSVLGQSSVKVKRLLYTLRPMLAAMWVMERRTPPPVRFAELTDAYLKPELRPCVDELLLIKRTLPEVGVIPAVPELDAFISETLPALHAAARQLPKEEPGDWAPLNTLFAGMLRRFECPKGD
ncbi:MAG: nucleotidyltransferase domain-containing protein [Clostridia bacterium]|nr:nucleotidyltransferase domain-containing protein [Clostridia bacterium]